MIILFGENGQVAREIRQAAQANGTLLQSFSSKEADFRRPDQISKILRAIQPGSTVINASAYTQVDLAETERDAATQVNGFTPGVIARVCRERGNKLIHISTDYVFSGAKHGPYDERDATGPLGVYGESKLLGESNILNNLNQAIILRTSWVFSAHGKNFVKTMVRLGADRDKISVVADQNGGPTSAESIARTCLQLAELVKELSVNSNVFGTYHYSGSPSTTWHGFAAEIFRQLNHRIKVIPIRTEEYPTPARRPANSILDCSKLNKNFGIRQPDWMTDLSLVLKQLNGSNDVPVPTTEDKAPTRANQKACS
jgi:dTDP-4-dehydrorhamnose reductase